MFEDLIYSFRCFKRSKTRTLLSLLGVIIGVASVIIITTLGQSASSNVKKVFSSANLNMVNVSSGFMRRRGRSGMQINEAFRKEIFGRLKNIKQIWFTNSLNGTLAVNDLSTSRNLTAVEYGYLETSGLKLGDGNYFSVSDCEEGAQVIILGSETAKALFPEGGAVGQRIVLQTDNIIFGFFVIGVLTGSTTGFESAETDVYITRGFYEKKIAPTADASTAIIEAINPKSASVIADEMKAYAQEKTGDEYALNIMSMQSILDQYDSVSGTMNLLLAGIAAISLLVGGIGIMNIMIVTVTERKKEIGIRKAIGASPAAIRIQFLVESASITLLGGALGIVIGIVISFVVILFMKWTFALQPLACIGAFLFSVLVGIFFGFYPASRAAKLDPVDALSAE
ncbi:MAG: ABC transporter permease [Termitinemataceae bacterium]|nr:MAG: ABC transporter permease [Termitinemataceae bacterium]